MNRRFGWQIVLGLLAIAMLAGVAQGLAEGGRAVAAPGGGVPVVAVWRPWGFGFGFFPFFPLLFILFWFVIVRGLFWRGAWGRGCAYGGVPPAFDEWHRRAHAQEGQPPSKANA